MHRGSGWNPLPLRGTTNTELIWTFDGVTAKDVLRESEEAGRERPLIEGKTRLAKCGTSPVLNRPLSPLDTAVRVGTVRRAGGVAPIEIMGGLP